MNYLEVEERIREGYREATAQYRRDDEIEVTTGNHRRLAASIDQICHAFAEPICALDVGCGTGRYFHCLSNVAQLTGIDISEEMLREARDPVRKEQITIGELRLERANAYLCTFPNESFHFIYSLGMFGHGCPVNEEICNRFHQWLKPGGKLLFNIVDCAGLPTWYRLRRRAKAAIYPLLTPGFQRILDERERQSPFFGLTKGELERVLRRTRFGRYAITSHRCHSPLWNGKHLECLATK